MQKIFNQKMAKLLDRIKEKNPNFNKNNFDTIIDTNFIECNNWLILSEIKFNITDINWNKRINEIKDSNSDSSYIEYSYNDFYLNDFLPKNHRKPLEWLFIWKVIMEKWAKKLKRKFPYYSFIILLSYDLWDYPWAKITFYKERIWFDIIDINNIEDYLDNWIYVIKT